MKTLVKITAICALVLVSFTANAQMKVGAGLGLVMPMGDFGDAAKMGFGAGVTGKYMLSDNMSLGLGIGYQVFTGKEDDKLKMNVIPISANFSYYFATEGLKPYAGIDLGYFMSSLKYDGEKVEDSSESDLGFAPVVGVEYELNDKMSLDINAKYNYVMSKEDDVEGSYNSTYLGINVGILFNL